VINVRQIFHYRTLKWCNSPSDRRCFFIEFFVETLYLWLLALFCVAFSRCLMCDWLQASRHKVSFLSHVPYITAPPHFHKKNYCSLSLFSQSDLPEKGQPKVDEIFFLCTAWLFLSSDMLSVRSYHSPLCGLTHHTTLIKLRKVIITWVWQPDPVDKVRWFVR
jgi:hypothetical protein